MGSRRGALLIEVLAALAIFSVAAVTCLAFLVQLSDSEHRAIATERRLTDQDRLMAAYSLLSREDLDRRLGRRVVGSYLVEVQRPSAELYRVTIGDSSAVDLATLLYRPDAAR